MMKVNKKEYFNKLYGGYVGKNIGGTLGTPYEGSREFRDIKGFDSEPGHPLPNDDLDLQLMWLYVLERYGASKMSTNLLADHWAEGIPPFWNEYGVGRTNLKLGMYPPLSGEYKNDLWKHSNGAWIRSEVWAGLAPFLTDIAAKYAVMDAMVDHGYGEGTYAEIFTASLESAAYYESDIRKLIDLSLAKIPNDSLLYQAVMRTIECYDNKIPYPETREILIKEFTAKIGWFQAPVNVSFVILGLLYGEGDFKNSVLYATNCGDDTDCTGATVGAVLGIIKGIDGIPKDWQEYIGDSIIPVAVNGEYVCHMPKSCTELAERILKQVPRIMEENGVAFEFTDGETEIPENIFKKFNKATYKDYLNESRFSYKFTENPFFDVVVNFDKAPEIVPNEPIKVRLHIINKVYDPRHILMKVWLPGGFTTNYYKKSVQIMHLQFVQEDPSWIHDAMWEVEITPGENIEAINTCYIEMKTEGHPHKTMIPIILVG